MALVYKRTTDNAARSYERSRGMEVTRNPGVSALTVITNGRGRRPMGNPFQWIGGRGQRHVHESGVFKTVRGARRWHGAGSSSARLYPIDEHGSIVSRPLRRNSDMGYDVHKLRAAIRRNADFGAHTAREIGAGGWGQGHTPSSTSRAMSGTRKRVHKVRRKGSRKFSYGHWAARSGGVKERRTRKGVRLSARGRKKTRRATGRRHAARKGTRRRATRRSAARKGTRRRRTRRNTFYAAANRRGTKRRGSRRARKNTRRRSRKNTLYAMANKRRRGTKRRGTKRRSSRRRTRRNPVMYATANKRRGTKRRGTRRRARRNSGLRRFRHQSWRYHGGYRN